MIDGKEIKINSPKKYYKNKKKGQLSFIDKTQSNTGSINSSGINSISFSLVSSGGTSKGKDSSIHNK